MLEQVTIHRPVEAAPRPSALKSILLHVRDDSSLDARLEVALSLARAADAHLSCLHVTPFQAYSATDSMGGVYLVKEAVESLEEGKTRLREHVEAKLGSEDVPWDYREVTGDVVSELVADAALNDLVVFGREPYRYDLAGPALGMIGELLHRSPTPLFIPGEESGIDVTGRAQIAWDGSYEAANAVRLSLGLLRLASEVSVVRVAEPKREGFPGTRLLEYLSRHGVHADLVVEDPPGNPSDPDLVAAMIAGRAKATRAAYTVMGGYSHNRVREFIFGGVTRTLLQQGSVPLVIAH